MRHRSGGPAPGRIGVALLGSTGSIGTQTVDVLTSDQSGRFDVVALAAGRDAATISAQATSLRPDSVFLASEQAAAGLELPEGTAVRHDAGALTEMAMRDDVDLVIVATGGVVSLRPVLAALEAGKIVATANKETLVAGGHLVMPLAQSLADAVATTDPSDPMASPLAWVRPIDSEHSAIWQSLVGEELDAVQRLILTASGGPFRNATAERLARVGPEDALKHPTWDMGAKITIDSATLMNKGLEVIEARWLYDVPYERVDVVVHPQSLIHSLVEFVDGSMKAQLGLPDMRIPIQYAVTYPHRAFGQALRLSLTEHPEMTFEAPDERRFPAIAVARAAGQAGPGSTAALIAADDIAVERFLAGTLSFMGITRLVEAAVERFSVPSSPSLEELEDIDTSVRAWAGSVELGGSST